jgi:hypothetical protein
MLSLFEAYKRGTGDRLDPLGPPTPMREPTRRTDAIAEAVLDGHVLDPSAVHLTEDDLHRQLHDFVHELCDRVPDPKPHEPGFVSLGRELRKRFRANRELAFPPNSLDPDPTRRGSE